MDPSPLLSAIQSLSGGTPSEKFKNLHAIVSEMVKNSAESTNFLNTGVTERIRPGLVPYLRILVGEKMKLNEAVIEALKSNDVTIIKHALNSKFFFDVNNPILNPEYFLENIIPYISLRTRRELIKTLARRLTKHPQSADKFFSSFSPVLGFEQTLPLVVACSEQYIENSILNRTNVIFPMRMLRILYRKYPQLIIRQLKSNKDWKKSYGTFLPQLIKNNCKEYVELFEKEQSYRLLTRLGSTRAKSFLKNSSEVLIDKPQIFFDILPLKLVSCRLGSQQFEKMFQNLLSESSKFKVPYFSKIAGLLKHYRPEKNKYPFLKKNYELIYKKDLLDVQNIFDESEFHKMVTDNELKAKIGKKSFASIQNKSEQDDHLYYLPPNESIPKLKEMVKTSEKPRSHWINQMITSCLFYNDKSTELLNVLKYYNERHKNERINILESILENLISKIHKQDISLNELHLQEIHTMIQRAYVKGEIFALSGYSYARILKNLVTFTALRDSLLNISDDTKSNDPYKDTELLVKIILEGFLERNKTWSFTEIFTDLEKEKRVQVAGEVVLGIFLSVLQRFYDQDHLVWDSFNKKLSISLELLPVLLNLKNKKESFLNLSAEKSNSRETSEGQHQNEQNLWNLGNKNLSLLKNFAKNLLLTDLASLKKSDQHQLKRLRTLVREYDPASYQNWIDENPEKVNDVESIDAMILLKRDHKTVLKKCKQYLDSCRKSLTFGNKFAKQFVLTSKWYQDIPTKFVRQCIDEIELEGSILILGILLEGSKFKDFIKLYLPEDKILDVKDDKTKKSYEIIKQLCKAINYTNPSVTLDVIIPFCQGDYVTLMKQPLMNVARRTALKNVLEFVDQLVEKPVSVRKAGIQIIFEVALKDNLQKFLVKSIEKETNRSIRELLVIKILDLFKQTANEEIWQIVVKSVEALSVNDTKIIQHMVDVRGINDAYLAQYVQKLVTKIDSFGDNELDKLRTINILIKKLDENGKKFPDDLIDEIVKKYMYKLNISFVLNHYLYPKEEKFEHRLTKFLEIMNCEVETLNQRDEKNPISYPSKDLLENFVRKLNEAFIRNRHEASLRIAQQILSLLESKYEPCDFPQLYIQLILLKAFLELGTEPTPKKFGVNCGKKLAEMVKRLSSDFFIRNIADTIQNTMEMKHYRPAKDVLDLIEGLMESDDYYGSLIGIHLLYTVWVESNDRYIRLLNTWSDSKNPTIRAFFNTLV